MYTCKLKQEQNLHQYFEPIALQFLDLHYDDSITAENLTRCFELAEETELLMKAKTTLTYNISDRKTKLSPSQEAKVLFKSNLDNLRVYLGELKSSTSH